MNYNIAKAWICTATTCVAFAAAAAPAIAKADYESAKARAASDYKTARAQCDNLAGNAKDVCIAEAKAARVHTESDAEAQYKNTPDAIADARQAAAKADYDVNRTRCDSQAGNAKDVCVKQAKATLTSAQADAKADMKAAEARADAANDINAADYKVAREKCDSYAGPAKDACIADAKIRHGM
ncbi:MAG: hypothetical protein JO002_16235 [Burkholderiaceae bacterium]|nr:hypothetical protein [Burkholderiaceae bacterium]